MRPSVATPDRLFCILRARPCLGLGLDALLFGALVFAAPYAGAQTILDRDVDSPSRGLALPGEALTGEASALSIETNPAQLGFLRAADGAWVSNVWGSHSALPGRGHGLFLGAPLGPLGIGTDLMDVQGLDAGAAHRWRFSLGFGLALGDRLALGAGWHRIFDYAGGGFGAYDLGASVRLANPIALAVTVEDLNQPSGLPRRLTGELLLRPLSSRALEIGATFRKTEGRDWSEGTPRLVLRWSAPRWLSVFAEAAFPIRTSPISLVGERDTLFALGVTFAAESLRLRGTVLGAALGDEAPGDSRGTWGGSVVVGASGVHAAPLAEYVARLDCRDLGDERSFLAFVTTLARLGNDPAVAAVYLRVRDLGLDLGRIEELRDRLHALRASGKQVFVHLTAADKRQLYLALAADRVFLHPAGQILLGGFVASRLWWKGAMDKIGVRGEMVRVAEYKGAMEPFVYDTETDAVRANTQSIVDDDYRRLVAALLAERPAILDSAKAESLLARSLILPGDAKNAGLVDDIVDESEGESALRAVLGRRGVAVRDWHPEIETPSRWFGSRVAVVLVEGSIDVEDSGPLAQGHHTSADSLVRALEGLESDSAVRAVLVRVNSGGGSALASERIVRALMRLKQRGRPVVVSFGDVAASGGYYVGTAGDLIFAEPSTLTGSIGVFAFKLDVSALMSRLGIFEERTSKGVPSDVFSPYHPWTPDDKRAIESRIDETYRIFLDHVVRARTGKGLDAADKVDAIARGRVWTGSQAITVGLVDQKGDFLRALQAAADLGRVPRDDHGLPRLRVVPVEDWKARLFKQVGGDMAEAAKDALVRDTNDGLPDPEERRRSEEARARLIDAVAPLSAISGPLGAMVRTWLRAGGSGVEAALPYVLTVQ
jgi:protease IV